MRVALALATILLLSDAAYAQQGIPRRTSPVRGVRLTSIENSTQEKALIDRFGIAAPEAMAGCDATSRISLRSLRAFPAAASPAHPNSARWRLLTNLNRSHAARIAVRLAIWVLIVKAS